MPCRPLDSQGTGLPGSCQGVRAAHRDTAGAGAEEGLKAGISHHRYLGELAIISPNQFKPDYELLSGLEEGTDFSLSLLGSFSFPGQGGHALLLLFEG